MTNQSSVANMLEKDLKSASKASLFGRYSALNQNKNMESEMIDYCDVPLNETGMQSQNKKRRIQPGLAELGIEIKNKAKSRVSRQQEDQNRKSRNARNLKSDLSVAKRHHIKVSKTPANEMTKR